MPTMNRINFYLLIIQLPADTYNTNGSQTVHSPAVAVAAEKEEDDDGDDYDDSDDSDDL